jgi:hypothetical protein
MARIPEPQHADPASALDGFSQCHAAIVAQLDTLALLPALAAAAARARGVAAGTLALFRNGVMEHHADEEKELFPAVLRSAQAGEERRAVAEMTERLTREHRAIEAVWKQLEPALRAVAKGAVADLDAAATSELIALYLDHARFEEREFLPLAARILGRDGNHMAALGLSLHLRHAPQPIAYV